MRAQLLDASPGPAGAVEVVERGEPADLVGVVEHLTSVQNEPTAAVVPAADLVLFDRLGASYRPQQLVEALEVDRTLYELDAMIYPTSHLELRLPEMAQWPPYERARRWLADNEPFRQDVLELLEREGPLPTSAIPDTSVVPWESSGWTAGKNVSQLLGLLARRGEIALAGRDGGERLWDVAWRVYPTVRSPVPAEEAHRRLSELRLAALGITRPGLRGTLQEPIGLDAVGVAAIVEGVRGGWRVDPSQLARLDEPFEARTVLLSPFDRLVFDRKRMLELFQFDYALEMYKPAEKRRWGYYALPILVGDRLVGKLDAASDFASGVFRVHAVHLDVALSADERASIDDAIDELSGWLGLEVAHGTAEP